MNSSRFDRGVTATVHARQALAEYVDRSVVIGVHGVTATRAGKARLFDMRPPLAKFDFRDRSFVNTVVRRNSSAGSRIATNGSDSAFRQRRVVIRLAAKNCPVRDHVGPVLLARAPREVARVNATAIVADHRLVTGIHASHRCDTLLDSQSHSMSGLLTLVPFNNTVSLPLGRKRPENAVIGFGVNRRQKKLSWIHQNRHKSVSSGALVLPPKVPALFKRQIINEPNHTSIFRKLLGLFFGGIKPVFLNAEHEGEYTSKPRNSQGNLLGACG